MNWLVLLQLLLPLLLKLLEMLNKPSAVASMSSSARHRLAVALKRIDEIRIAAAIAGLALDSHEVQTSTAED